MTRSNNTITQRELKYRYSYNEWTGVFTCKRTFLQVGSFIYNGSGNKYVRIVIKNKKYKAHRLAWLYVYGEYPSGEIDHINGNGVDNRIRNLRDVSHSENQKNRKLRKGNISGCSGVYKTTSGVYNVNISNNGENIYLGRYADYFDACCARKSAEAKYGYHENHGKR